MNIKWCIHEGERRIENEKASNSTSTHVNANSHKKKSLERFFQQERCWNEFWDHTADLCVNKYGILCNQCFSECLANLNLHCFFENVSKHRFMIFTRLDNFIASCDDDNKTWVSFALDNLLLQFDEDYRAYQRMSHAKRMEQKNTFFLVSRGCIAKKLSISLGAAEACWPFSFDPFGSTYYKVFEVQNFKGEVKDFYGSLYSLEWTFPASLGTIKLPLIHGLS